MRTIKTYSKGAPFYNASGYLNVAIWPAWPRTHPMETELISALDDTTVYSPGHFGIHCHRMGRHLLPGRDEASRLPQLLRHEVRHSGGRFDVLPYPRQDH